MKIAFICIVVVISCGSSRVSGDLEFYPDSKLNYGEQERRPRLHKYDPPRRRFYSKLGYPWRNAPFEQNVPMDDYSETETRELPGDYDALQDKIRQFKEIINYEKAILQHRPRHESSSYGYDPQNLNKPRDFNIPNVPTLDEVRMYPQEGEFAFKNNDNDEDDEEGDDEEENRYGEPKFEEKFQEDDKDAADKLPMSNEEASRIMHHEHDTSAEPARETFESTRFQDVKLTNDPSEFAFAPPDPRFYRKTEASDKKDPEIELEKLKELHSAKDATTKQFKVIQRSDQKSIEEQAEKTAVGNENIVPRMGATSEDVVVKPNMTDVDSAGVYIIAIVAGISAAATVGLIAVGIGWYNLQKHVKNAADVEYPAYGVTGPNKDVSPSGDRRLAQSAQMYHYQHQKQQIIAMERAPPGERPGSISDAESDEENEEGDYTVYECPGLAPTGEMEVKNPMFQDDPTPAQTPATKPNSDETK